MSSVINNIKLEIKKNIIALNFEFLSLSPIFTHDITMNDKIFINILNIPCPVERHIIIFLGKKLVKPKKPLLYNASTKPKINLVQKYFGIIN